jgi:hypothetical protein
MVRICSVNHETRVFFSCSGRVSFQAPKIRCANKLCVISRKVLFVKVIAYLIFERAETEIRFSMANCMFKNKMDIDRHGPRRMPNNYQHLDPLYFSLRTTFNSSRLARNVFMNIGSGCQVSPLTTLLSKSRSLWCRWVLDPPLHLLRQLTHL